MVRRSPGLRDKKPRAPDECSPWRSYVHKDGELEVLHRAVNVDGWPASAAAGALLLIAGDPASQGPMRLTCPGPWWDAAERGTGEAAGCDAAIAAELETMETRLAEAGGQRVWAQQQARADLAIRNQPVTRLTVFRRACELLSEAECQPC